MTQLTEKLFRNILMEYLSEQHPMLTKTFEEERVLTCDCGFVVRFEHSENKQKFHITIQEQ